MSRSTATLFFFLIAPKKQIFPKKWWKFFLAPRCGGRGVAKNRVPQAPAYIVTALSTWENWAMGSSLTEIELRFFKLRGNFIYRSWKYTVLHNIYLNYMLLNKFHK